MMFARSFDAFLFDMDGTLVDSHVIVVRVWGAWLAKHGLDVERVLPTVHGVRIADTMLRLAVPGLDPEREAAEVTAAETADVDGIRPIPGAKAFFEALPEERRAIVTSATRTMALRRLAAAGIATPAVLITGDDVPIGKPAPDCFLLAASRLRRDVRDCLVFEDATAGIKAAEAAGAHVVVIGTTHVEPYEGGHPCIKDYGELRLEAREDGLAVRRRG